MTIEAPTTQEFVAHLKTGATACLVCDAEPIVGGWTDYNGQIRCHACGMTYQILGSHLTEEFMREHGLEKADVAERYCDAFTEWPLCRLYWQQMGKQIPFGTYLGQSPISVDAHETFYRWIWENRSEIKPAYSESFRWDVLEERFDNKVN
jgi:hypothetical protein